MKKLSLIMPLIAAAAFTSCSSDEPIGAGQTTTPDGEGTGNESYVTFSIASVNSNGSRADYEDGSEAEGEVKNVVLFFYDEKGEALNVNIGTTNSNYKIIENPVINAHTEQIGSTGNEYNVEHWFQHTQQLNTKSPITKAKVLAWVNVNTTTNADGYPILMNFKYEQELRGNISMRGISGPTAYFTGNTYNRDKHENPEFVMTSSVYLDETTDNTMCEVDVNIFTNKTDAEKAENIATIYVERVKARVKLTENSSKKTGDYYKPNLDDETFPSEVTASDLKLKVLGWTLNTVCKEAYFFKQIADNKTYGFEWKWNDPAHHRSYWEDGYSKPASTNNVDKAADNSVYDKVKFTPQNITTQPSDVYQYLNPNTTSTPTYALVCTQLFDASNRPVSIAKWLGNNFLESELPKAVLSTLTKGKVFVESTGKADATQYVDLSEKHISFKQGNGYTAQTNESWRAYPVLTKQINGTDVQYYEKVETSTSTSWNPISYDKANALIGFYKSDTDLTYATEGAKIWKNGLAYYFVPIKHFGNDEASRVNGVVRNHSYNIEIEGFKGLGTPIYEPGTEIPEPDLPEDDKESYVAVKMNVLSWRIVPKQSVIFGGK